MTSPRRARVLRCLAMLGLAATAACQMDNPGFKFDRGSGGTSTGTSTTPTTGLASSTTTDASTSTSGATTDGVSSSGPTATATSEPGSTSSVDTGSLATSDSTGMTSDSTTGGCPEKVIEIPAEADGFYIAGGTLGGTTCGYPSDVKGKLLPCRSLNFGITQSLRLVRGAGEFEGMYAVRFVQSALIQLQQQGITSASAELVVSMFAAPPAVVMRVGKINVEWFEGLRDGLPAQFGDSNFENSKISDLYYEWSKASDGPRGASTEVAELSVPAVFPDPTFIASTSFAIDDWLKAPEAAQGLVLSFYKNDAVGLEGPSIHTRESALGPMVRPFLRVRYCEP